MQKMASTTPCPPPLSLSVPFPLPVSPSPQSPQGLGCGQVTAPAQGCNQLWEWPPAIDEGSGVGRATKAPCSLQLLPELLRALRIGELGSYLRGVVDYQPHMESSRYLRNVPNCALVC